jgi:23S rRNA pseudouridine2457 synthase
MCAVPEIVVLNKPFDVVSRFTLPGNAKPGTRTLTEFITESDLYPAGLLDRDSEGLLILTNDGGLQHRLTDPQHGHKRTYLVQVEGTPNEAALQQLTNGSITLEGRPCKPAEAAVTDEPPWLWKRVPPIRFRAARPTSWLSLTLTEGRNRQVRRMTAAVGLPTLRLVRTEAAGLQLEGLAPGEWRRESLKL